MDLATRQFVRHRAGYRCEYCLLHQDDCSLTHHVEHIVAKQHGGTDEEDNLALACHRCNLGKGPNLTGVDPLTQKTVSLFHPRRDLWPDHFEARAAITEGITAIGRATVQVLATNDPRRVELRRQILARDQSL
jgi:5-methylcytosine-specific restriction endonuclease McrA